MPLLQSKYPTNHMNKELSDNDVFIYLKVNCYHSFVFLWIELNLNELTKFPKEMMSKTKINK